LKKKVHKLSGTGASHFRLLGISSHENDHRLSWAVNHKLELNFRKTENIVIGRRGNIQDKLEFSQFRHIKEDEILKMNLISNRCPNGFLITEMKNIDFFLQVFGDVTQPFVTGLIASLRRIEIISAVFEIQPASLKSSRNLPPE
jgi:hypothetical protein